MSKLHVTVMIDSLRVGGAERLQLTFAQAIRDYPVQLSIISLSDTKSSFESELNLLDIELIQFPGKSLFDRQRFRKLRQYLKTHPCDLLHCHLTTANILGGILGKLHGIPVIATLHNVAFKSPGEKEIRVWLETFVLRYMVQKIVAIGHTVAKAQQPRFGNKPLEIIPNAVPLLEPKLQQGKKQAQLDLIGFSTDKLLISVGRLEPQKAFADLINAFADVLKAHPDARLIIVGDGQQREALESQINQIGLEDEIKLLGLRNDVPQLLAISDLFVLSSHWEGLPVAILEAMSVGLPVVATEVGDIPNIVSKETGDIVPAKQPDQLAKTIHQMLNDQQQLEELGCAARKVIENQYSVEAWGKRIFNLYVDFYPRFQQISGD